MATTQATFVLRRLRDFVAAENSNQLPDRQLLDRFTARRDGPAFEALVRRHGALVLGVCRRVLRDWHDAEDAFQATFLALARKAGSIGQRDAVGGWLYRVAYHTALRARAKTGVRQKHESAAGIRPPADPLADLTGRELLAVLDEEMQHLPECYRTPLVLCFLQEKTRDEAARQLGWSVRTLGRRLEEGKKRLRGRLARRGLSLPAALLAAEVMSTQATAAVPPVLAAATVKAALATVSGETGAVAALAREGLRVLAVGKLKTVSAVLLTLGLVGASLLAGGARVTEAPTAPAKEPDQPSPAKAAAEKDSNKMIVSGRVLGPDGKPVSEATVAVAGRPRRQYRSGDVTTDRTELLAEGKTDAAGRFRLTAPRISSARYWEVYAVAAARGYALAFQQLNPDVERPEAVLTLLSEQIFRGRLVDLQGVPAAGVKVSVAYIGSMENDEAQGVSLEGLPKRLAIWPEPAVTDEKGRFVLRGINRARGAALRSSHPRFGDGAFEVLPVGKPQAGRRNLAIDAGGYVEQRTTGPDDKGQPEEPTFTLVAAHFLEGRVVYADTGKPAAGANILGTLTDKDGRFRVRLGAPKAVTVVVYAPPGEPYLNTYRRVEWPKGAVKHEVEIKLPRGVLVRGKVTEAGGAPVAGACVQFWPRQVGNRDPLPNVITGWQTCELTKADGSFAITVLPGSGYLLFQGPTPDYIHAEIGHETLYSGKPGGGRMYPDAFVKLDVPEKGDVKDLAVTLRRGVTVRGKLLGADGKPVAKAVLLHRLHIYHDLGWHFAAEARDGVFEVHGLDPDKNCPLFFLDAEHQWGAVVSLSGQQAGQEVTVRLAPCGKATARYLDGKGKPFANLKVAPDIVITPARAAFSADKGSLIQLDRHNYWDKVKTDAAGRVTFPALIPGATYQIERWEKDRWVLHREFTVKSGQTVDLGDVTIERSE